MAPEISPQYRETMSVFSKVRRQMRQEGLFNRLGPDIEFRGDSPPRILLIARYPRQAETEAQRRDELIATRKRKDRIHDLLTIEGMSGYQSPRDPLVRYNEEIWTYVLQNGH
jgi:hypothetical protein